MKLLIFSQDPENCTWCKRYDPVVEKLRKDGYEIEVVNAFTPEGVHNPRNKDWDIASTPTTIVLDDDGKELGRFGPTTYKNALDRIGALL